MPNSGPSRLLLGIDLGSSATKAILLDPNLGIVASASRATELHSPKTGWAEAEAGDWWRNVTELVPELLAAAGVGASDVVGIACSGMVPAVLCLDENLAPLRRAILQNDARAHQEITELRLPLADLDLLALTGSVLTQQSVAPTALWLARNEPEVWARTKYIVGSYDWLSMRLGARSHVERNWAIESGLYNWDGTPVDAVIASTEIRWPELQEVVDPSTIVGWLSRSAARELGLEFETPIVVGGADHVLSAFGAGLVDEGDWIIKLGGAGDILAVSDTRFLDARLYLDAHAIPGKWLPNGCMATSGSALRWEQDILGGIDLAVLDLEAEQAEPGALLTLPYFLGEKSPLHDPDLRGAVLGLHLGTTRGDLHRSFLEAIAYGFRQHMEIFTSRGLKLGSPRVTNGGSKSTLWKEILADVIGLPLTPLIGHPGASLGAAVIAGIATGNISDWSQVNQFVRVGDLIEPDPANRTTYDERYENFLEFQSSSSGISHALAKSGRA
ncbi:MAG TPA: FGGY family carbohydrate kinase [Candidatus Nanopelagicaceae bacterium]|nr:FGGY family carbohydrate kinase [Candidatus Nanopelagicaceae bacterium]